ncbi:MAG: phosphoribosyltransferase [Cytophagaceae bacterium]
MFKNRKDAAYKLAEKLVKYKNSDGIVMAIPRGGVEIGYVLATELDMFLDVVMIKKIGHPKNPEYAVGSVSLYGRILDHHYDVTQEYIEEETKKIRKLLKERHEEYLRGRSPFEIKGKTVILADDGIATGNTLFAAIHTIKKSEPAEIIVAAPLAPAEVVEKLREIVDDVVVEEIPKSFYGVGQFYEDFKPVSDEEAVRLLRDFNHVQV